MAAGPEHAADWPQSRLVTKRCRPADERDVPAYGGGTIGSVPVYRVLVADTKGGGL